MMVTKSWLFLLSLILLTGCDDSFFFSWDGTWRVERRGLTVDLGECNSSCRTEVDSLFNGQIEIRCDTSYSSFGKDTISCRLGCKGRCAVFTGNFSGEEYRVNERSIVDLSGSLRLDQSSRASPCGLVMPNGQLTLVKNSNSSISFTILGQARNWTNGRRCRVTMFGDAKK